MLGLIMNRQLTITSIMEHSRKFHGDAEGFVHPGLRLTMANRGLNEVNRLVEFVLCHQLAH